MVRRIIKIDEQKCNGCGLCARACHEGAIAIINNKAKLMRDDYCDGLGDCLPACPAGAISFEERDAAAYDEAAVRENKKQKNAANQTEGNACNGGETGIGEKSGCPGHAAKIISREVSAASAPEDLPLQSELRQWPVQLRLVSPGASYFDGADLLIAADCTAFAHGDFHRTFMKDHVTLIACPKLDPVEYTEKLTAIFAQNKILSVKILRMEVPCCGGLERAVKQAILNSKKQIPCETVVLKTNGAVLSDDTWSRE